ncbi:MAG: DoxX family protein [Draconibacterium sp.]
MDTVQIFTKTFLLRFGVAIIFLSHSLHGIFTNNDVNDFGNLFLDKIGFAPFGIFMAWGVVISQIITSFLLITNRIVKISCIINITILIFGIITVHFNEGWYVVGAGRNGMEFSFILIVVLFTIIIQNKVTEKQTVR